MAARQADSGPVDLALNIVAITVYGTLVYFMQVCASLRVTCE